MTVDLTENSTHLPLPLLLASAFFPLYNRCCNFISQISSVFIHILVQDLPVSMNTQGASPSSSPSSSSTLRWKYEVFLSFRGKDTRNSFTDHLYNALVKKGIFTFRDDEELERGEPISKELPKAIAESRVAIVILSKRYASSTWCLDELAKILKCKKEMGLIVLPVFHYVRPSDVRDQKGSFKKDFAKHEADNTPQVKTWRDAFTEVASFSGWTLEEG